MNIGFPTFCWFFICIIYLTKQVQSILNETAENELLHELGLGVDQSETPLKSSEHNLKDFFWTGSGDGPPAPQEVQEVIPEKPIPVYTTVYINLNHTNGISPEDETNLLESSIPDGLQSGIEDKRYWLITVVQGRTPDSLQLKLSKLYKLAFLRQQERHLGLIKADSSILNLRKKHEVTPHNSIQNYSNYLWHASIIQNTNIYSTINTTELDAFENEKETPFLEPSSLDPSNSWVLATPYLDIENFDIENDTLDVFSEGLNYSFLLKREIIKPEEQPPVTVFIRNITQRNDSVEIIYVVFVGGRAVPARIAARDMRLVRDGEVAEELGYPVNIKAEPYIKSVEMIPEENWKASSLQLWMIIAGAIAAALFLAIILFVTCRLARRKKITSSPSLHSFRNELIKAAQQAQMKQLYDERDEKLVRVISSGRTRPSSTALPVYREGSISSSSSGSGLSEIASALKRRQRRIQKARSKKVAAVDSFNSSPQDSAYSPHGTGTPTSFLSMPSIRSFPRTISVEPLSKVLQPISVKHLDIETPSYDHYSVQKEIYKIERTKKKSEKDGSSLSKELEKERQIKGKIKESPVTKSGSHQLVRLGSMDRDPGVIGPPVWTLHKTTVSEASKYNDSSSLKQKEEAKMSVMRQRFNELIGDSSSIFGSRVSSPDSRLSTGNIGKDRNEADRLNQARNENVIIPKSRVEFPYTISPRPSTSETPPAKSDHIPTRPNTSITGSSGLIVSNVQHRPPAVPRINPAFVRARGSLQDDPAYPLIKAIKSEISRIRTHRTFD